MPPRAAIRRLPTTSLKEKRGSKAGQTPQNLFNKGGRGLQKRGRVWIIHSPILNTPHRYCWKKGCVDLNRLFFQLFFTIFWMSGTHKEYPDVLNLQCGFCKTVFYNCSAKLDWTFWNKLINDIWDGEKESPKGKRHFFPIGFNRRCMDKKAFLYDIVSIWDES